MEANLTISMTFVSSAVASPKSSQNGKLFLIYRGNSCFEICRWSEEDKCFLYATSDSFSGDTLPKEWPFIWAELDREILESALNEGALAKVGETSAPGAGW